MMINAEAEAIRARNIRIATERFLRARRAYDRVATLVTWGQDVDNEYPAVHVEYNAAFEALEFAMYSDVRDYL